MFLGGLVAFILDNTVRGKEEFYLIDIKQWRSRVYFSGKEDKHEHGVGFLVHKDIVKSVIGCRPISSKLMTVRLRVKR